VAHPSLTNCLEILGGSNFGILDDNCQPSIASGIVISMDAVTPV
jgi:hypothetical protein